MHIAQCTHEVSPIMYKYLFSRLYEMGTLRFFNRRVEPKKLQLREQKKQTLEQDKGNIR
jgi:hypothetical protein